MWALLQVAGFEHARTSSQIICYSALYLITCFSSVLDYVTAESRSRQVKWLANNLIQG